MRHLATPKGLEFQAQVEIIVRQSAKPAPLPSSVESPDLPNPRAILTSIGEVVYDWDVATDSIRWGPNLDDVLGPAAGLHLGNGNSFTQFVAPDSPGRRDEAVLTAAPLDRGAGAPFRTQYGLMLPQPEDGEWHQIWLEDSGRVFCGPDRKPLRVHGVIRIIQERGSKHLAGRSPIIFDALTGAFERRMFVERVSRALSANSESTGSVAVMLVEVKSLDRINKMHGFDAGDEVLSGMADLLRARLRTCDSLGRYAGACLAVLMQNCDAEQVRMAAARLTKAIEASTFQTCAGPVTVTAKIGVCLSGPQARSAQPLLYNAEAALEKAHASPTTAVVMFDGDQSLAERRLRNARIADDIVAALNERRIKLALQPIVDARSGKPKFFEALMRMIDRDGQMIAPGHVFPIAEEAGLVGLIDYRILELVMEQLDADPALTIAINTSSRTLADREWPQHLATTLSLHPGSAARLIIEITETSAIEDIEATCNVVRAMKALGVQVAMDDFGAGHTSFRNLRKLNVDILKIDGAFMPNLMTSPDDRYFVRTMVDLAHHLGILVVAEWVEDHDTAALLAEWGADLLQGHLFGRAELAAERPHASKVHAGQKNVGRLKIRIAQAS